MSKLKSRLPGSNRNVQEMEDFIAGAETKTKPTPTARKATHVYPWQESGVRDDVLKMFNLRLPEPYLLKLKFIAENTPDSMQRFCLQVLQDEIDNKINDLTS